MVFFNWATMQMAAKIVYYGPGLCGKTTNLSFIYTKTAPGSRGEMVSLETETDRTLFFDLLPLEVGKVAGFRTRLQLYTVPGQVFYNTTRKLVLKGVDGVVFVADSQRPMAEANIESIKNLEENLGELGLSLTTMPVVLQYNKRDLRNILSVEEMNAALNPRGSFEFFESIAVDGTGVFETLKAITKTTLKSLRRRMATQDTAAAKVPSPLLKPQRVFDPAALSAAAEAGLKAAEPTVDAAIPTAASPPLAETSDAGAMAAATDGHPLSAEAVEDLPATMAVEETAPGTEPPVAIEAEVEPPAMPMPVAEEVEEAAVEFDTTPEEAAPPADSEVRHVKVSSSLGILAELENLRKSSTYKFEERHSHAAPSLDIDSLLQGSLNSKMEVKRRLDEKVGDSLGRATRCLVHVELVNGSGDALRTMAPVEIELTQGPGLRQLALTLLVNLQAE